ncbi:RND family efflux transporter, MFP subunit [Duganella sp. CF517]|uniref:efflux RND transporter periplasmic adaptor subunit n=1 Tax=Duganella sp. CF517 TaxID=1881038 RepID=UPI0008AD7CA0|nr:efflux RND transporter periplasmic adaptor subunit [Duganella sp. CF517]SEN88031.1 RND family efflux transporter, MFP subunit [Duganella sp. CF517]
MKNRRHQFFYLAAVLAAVLAYAVIALAMPESVKPLAAAPRSVLTVEVATPQAVVLPLRLAANGNIAAWQEASIGAEADGLRLAEVKVNVGDVVRRGQVLATFASATVGAELAQSRAAAAEAEAALAEADANAARAHRLQTTGALSAQQIEQYLTAGRTARARLDALRAAEHTRQLRLAQTRVLAPDDGVISARGATVGAVPPAGQELFRLILRGRLEWRAEVAAPDLAQLKPGQRALVTPAGGKPIEGRVRMVAPAVDPLTRNALVYVDLPPGGAARAGMFARGVFETGTAPALTLPQSAVQVRDGFSFVLRVGADSRVVRTKVGVGRRAGDLVEITGGIAPPARVVAAGGGFLGDGDLVSVAPSAAARASTTAAVN